MSFTFGEKMIIFRYILVIVAISAVGLFIGWLVGASSSPVVSAVLPLVFSLVGGIGLGYISSLEQRKEIKQKSEEAESCGDVKLRKLFELAQFDLSRVLVLWSIATIVFCATCYVGIKFGIAERQLNYPALSEWLPVEHDLSPPELAEGHRLWLILQEKGVDRITAKRIFTDVFVALINHPSIKPGGEREGNREHLISIAVAKFEGKVTTTSGIRLRGLPYR